MSDDIEQHLTAAAEAMREFEVCGQRRSELRQRQDALAAELAAAREQRSDDDKDVERLEGLSLTRVLTSLRGSRDDALVRERAEADAARYRMADAQSRLDAVGRELAETEGRLDQLAGAPQAYSAALTEKERHLTESADPRGSALLSLADDRGRLTAEVNEMTRAQQAADVADQALSQVRERLGSAASWSTYDTFFGGGVIGSAVKHERIDEAAQAAAEADRRLAVLRTDLTDIASLEPTEPQLQVGAGLRFADIFFNSIFTDLAVGRQIRQAQENIDRSIQLVGGVRTRLADQIARAQAKLTVIEAQRQELLTSQLGYPHGRGA